MKRSRVWFLGVCVLLMACGTPIQASPAPTPQAINIIYPASLKPWTDQLVKCAVQYPQAALNFFQGASQAGSIHSNEIEFSLGQPAAESTGNRLYQIGWEQIVVVINRENPLERLSNDALRQIYSGRALNWENQDNQHIQVWVLPDEEPVQQIFTRALGLTDPFATEARLAPNPIDLLTVIAKDENAIGYLPQSYLSNPDVSAVSQIKLVALDPDMDQALRQPVIAITGGEPSDLQRDILACIQKLNP